MLELGAEIKRKKNGTRKTRLGKVYGICSRYGPRGREATVCGCSVEELRVSLGYWIRGRKGEE